MVVHKGSCHCGAVKFEVEAPEILNAVECNCSICEMTGYLHLIVPASKFRILKGTESLTTYTFNTGTAKHTFCQYCGVKPFYIPRSNPDGYDININCLDKDKIKDIKVELFDGRNWEENVGKLSHISEE